jgi:hypothetical protein
VPVPVPIPVPVPASIVVAVLIVAGVVAIALPGPVVGVRPGGMVVRLAAPDAVVSLVTAGVVTAAGHAATAAVVEAGMVAGTEPGAAGRVRPPGARRRPGRSAAESVRPVPYRFERSRNAFLTIRGPARARLFGQAEDRRFSGRLRGNGLTVTVTCPALQSAAPGLPDPRGPLSAFLVERWRGPCRGLTGAPAVRSHDPLADDDLQLALYLCYELHYRSFAGVDETWEWEPSLLQFRRRLEDRFETALREAVGSVEPGGDAALAVQGVVSADTGRSLSAWCLEHATLAQFVEFAVHRSAYQLKEADPHTWVIPRLEGRAKAACVEIQADEYGGGRESEMHCSLFTDVLCGLGLDPAYGAYLDHLPGITLATVNLISLFGLHRRWRGALVGHLAAFEMSSVVPMSRYAAAVDRLGLPAAARRFYDVHVDADAHHGLVAFDGLIRGLTEREPGLAADVVFGARALTAVEGRFTAHLLDAWTAGRSSLRRPLV